MGRKVYVVVTTRLMVNLEEGESVDDMISEMDYNFDYRPDEAENRIQDTEIRDFEVIDSK